MTFTVDADTRLDEATHATVKYRNLIGQRYISLTQEGDSGQRLAEDAAIPVDRTKPALDLTVLFNGFKPLFQALSPDDINKLSYEIVQVFQGEGGTVEGLLSSTASVTQTLADRDQVIGELLSNLDYVLDHVADRDKQLTNLIDSFRSLIGGLNDDREAILGSLDSISELSVQTAALVTDIKDPFIKDIKELRKSPGPSTTTAKRSTARFRCCRSSSPRSAAPPPTARGSTSTCATSRPRSRSPDSTTRSAPPMARPPTAARSDEGRTTDMKPFRERNPVVIGR